jgi:DNA (cytosine-5)-methyltransferase 1
MKAVSLFAGVGGFDLALERAGVTVVASCEIDKYAQKVLAQHFPNSTIINDVKDVTGDQLKQLGFDGSDGIIVGGFPCQDLSVAGKRAGLAGSRSGLFWEICRILDETKAKWFVLENVPGLLSSNDGRDMGTVIQALVERGYGVSYRILDAQYFGVAQRRRRVFIVGCLGDDGRASAEVLALVEGMRGHLETSNTKREKTSRGSSSSTGESDKKIARMRGFGDYELDHKAGALKARDWKDATDLVYPEGTVGTITTAFGAKNYSNHQELMEGSVVVYDELVREKSQSAKR